MSPDILIIREGNAYRILHGHLRLANELSQRREVIVETRDDGQVKVVRTRHGYFAGADGQCLPVRTH